MKLIDSIYFVLSIRIDVRLERKKKELTASGHASAR
jgi:hypothetical protein